MKSPFTRKKVYLVPCWRARASIDGSGAAKVYDASDTAGWDPVVIVFLDGDGTMWAEVDFIQVFRIRNAVEQTLRRELV